MRITWSLPVRGERLGSSRGDLVRAAALVHALRALGHDVEVVEDSARPGASLAVGGYRRLVRRILPARLALILRDAGRVLHSRGHGRRVSAAALRARADVLVETQVHFTTSGARASRAAGVPLILDDCSPSSEEIALGCGLPALARRAFRRQAAQAGALLVPSLALRDALAAEGVPTERVHVLPNGVDPEQHERARAGRDATRRELGLDGRIVLAFVGSFQPWHRAELLPQAIAALRGLPALAGRPRLALLLVGDGPGRAACVAAARAIEGLVLADLGFVAPSRVPDLLAASDVGVLPGSNDWGQPMKLLEYAAAGLPCVAPDLPPVREMLEPGRTGLLFRSGDAEALAAGLGRLLEDSEFRTRLGEVARSEVAAPATWMRRASELVSVANVIRTSRER